MKLVPGDWPSGQDEGRQPTRTTSGVTTNANYFNHKKRSSNMVPVAAFLCEQLFELSECDYPPFDRCPVGDGFSAEVVGHSDVFTGRPLRRLVPARDRGLKMPQGSFQVSTESRHCSSVKPGLQYRTTATGNKKETAPQVSADEKLQPASHDASLRNANPVVFFLNHFL